MVATPSKLTEIVNSLDEDRTAIAYALRREAQTLRSDGPLHVDTVLSATGDYVERTEHVARELESAFRSDLGVEVDLSNNALPSPAGLRSHVAALEARTQVRRLLTECRSITCNADTLDLTPVHECRATVESTIAAAAVEDVPDDLSTERLSDHPLAHLLRLVSSGEEVTDQDWEQVFESVRAAFGSAIAVAAARGRIRLDGGSRSPEE